MANNVFLNLAIDGDNGKKTPDDFRRKVNELNARATEKRKEFAAKVNGGTNGAAVSSVEEN